MKKIKLAHNIWPEDVAQLVFGSAILSVPVAYTEETWRIGESLHSINILLIFLLSIVLISIAIFYTGYHARKKGPALSYCNRVILTYLIVFATTGIFLTLITKAPWFSEPLLAVKRVVIVSLPASISGVAADMIK